MGRSTICGRLATSLAFFVLGAGCSLLLQGCGDDNDGGDVVVDPGTTTTVTTTTSVTTTTTVTTSTAPRAGSFLVIGDWGWDADIHGGVKSVACQQTIADAMKEKMTALGDVRFVINVGDSFYPGGVANRTDPQWDTKWRNIYPKVVRSVPWYSVYGNHDLYFDNCTCSHDLEQCAQVNTNTSDLDYFYMPNVSYHVQHEDLDVEIVALDMNYQWANHTCKYTQCPDACFEFLKSREEKAFEFFYERMSSSQAKTMLVFSHYPSDYFWAYPKFLAELSNASRHHVEFYGGHRHNVDNTSVTSIAPNSAWLVGGGGGWGCESYGTEQGFLVGEIGLDGTVTTYPALVNYSMCCEA